MSTLPCRGVPLVVLGLGVSLACSNGDEDPTPTESATVAAPSREQKVTQVSEPTSTPEATTTPELHPPGAMDPVQTVPVPAPAIGASLLVAVRMADHPELGGWDRIVLEFEDSLPEGRIRYVDSIAACGSGDEVNLAGQAILAVTFGPAAAHDEEGQLTIDDTLVPGPGLAILEARQTCDFEAEVSWALGVAGPRNFTVVVLDSPPRVVVDVKD